MKKTFKKLLGSALAAVMTTTCLTVGMATTVSAADHNEYGSTKVSADGKTKTWNFLDNQPKESTALAGGDTVLGITITDNNNSQNPSYKSGDQGLSLRESMALSVPVPTGCTGNFTIVFTSSSSGRMVAIENDTAAQISTSGNKYTFTSTDTKDGDIDVVFSTASGKDDGDRKIGSITVEITSEHAFEIPVTYTLSGSCTGLSENDTFELTNGTNTYKVTVGADNTYSTSVQGDAFVEGTYTASLTNYGIEYGDGAAAVTIAAASGSTTEFTATPAITFTKLELQPLAAGTYKTADVFAGMPNFDCSGLKESQKLNNGESIDFMVNDGATVTVNWYCGSDKSSRNAKPDIRQGSDVKASAPEAQAGGSNLPILSFTASNLAAGTYSIYSTASSTSTRISSIVVSYGPYVAAKAASYDSAAVVNDGTSFYAVAVVKGSEIASSNTVAVNTSKAVSVDSSDTVYGSIKIGTAEFKAVDLLDSASADDKVFATCISNDNNTNSVDVLAKVAGLAVSVQ